MVTQHTLTVSFLVRAQVPPPNTSVFSRVFFCLELCQGVSQLVDDLVWNQEAAGSSPATLTQFQFRKTRARCMGWTVNPWLGEFDPHIRSQVMGELAESV